MIPKAVVDAFIGRARDDHRWIKRLSPKALDIELASLKPRPRLYAKARSHQKASFLLGVAYPRFGYWIDMGGGKTLLSLELLRYWWDCGRVRRALILVTSDKAYLTWEAQIAKFGIDLPYVFLDGSGEDKWRQLESLDRGLVIVHYPGLVALLTRAVKDDRKTHWVIDTSKLERFGGFDAIVADESTKLGNSGSLTFRIVETLGRRAFAFYALAGRPFGRDPAMLWPQYLLLDGGETLGDTLGLFREAFFTAKKNRQAARRGGRRGKYVMDYKFNRSKMGQLTRIIQHRSITYSTEEFPDMPPISFTPIQERVTLPEEGAVYFKRLVDQVISASGNLSEMKSVFTRMRQLSSGFMAFRDDENGDRVELEFDQNPKLDRLVELLEEMPADRQAVVFYAFTHSGRRIIERLEKLNISAIWLWSGTKRPTDELKRFIGGKARVAVVNNQVGAYSLDGLQVANYAFFYESPVAVIDREQAERRLRRDGQKLHVFQYDLIVRDTVDDKILMFHQEGRSLYKELSKDPSKFFSD